jgi:hypothetical protein
MILVSLDLRAAPEPVVERIRSSGRHAFSHGAEVSQEHEVEDMFQNMLSKFAFSAP